VVCKGSKGEVLGVINYIGSYGIVLRALDSSRLRDELIAKRTLSAAVGAGQSEVNAQISSNKTVSGWCSQSPSLRLSGLLPEPMGNLWRS
jgi:hypothetical protein